MTTHIVCSSCNTHCPAGGTIHRVLCDICAGIGNWRRSWTAYRRILPSETELRLFSSRRTRIVHRYDLVQASYFSFQFQTVKKLNRSLTCWTSAGQRLRGSESSGDVPPSGTEREAELPGQKRAGASGVGGEVRTEPNVLHPPHLAAPLT